MPLWEYKVFKGFLNEAQLDEIGADEWELVTVILSNNEAVADFFYFKRPVEDDEDDEDEEHREDLEE